MEKKTILTVLSIFGIFNFWGFLIFFNQKIYTVGINKGFIRYNTLEKIIFFIIILLTYVIVFKKIELYKKLIKKIKIKSLKIQFRMDYYYFIIQGINYFISFKFKTIAGNNGGNFLLGLIDLNILFPLYFCLNIGKKRHFLFYVNTIIFLIGKLMLGWTEQIFVYFILEVIRLKYTGIKRKKIVLILLIFMGIVLSYPLIHEYKYYVRFGSSTGYVSKNLKENYEKLIKRTSHYEALVTAINRQEELQQKVYNYNMENYYLKELSNKLLRTKFKIISPASLMANIGRKDLEIKSSNYVTFIGHLILNYRLGIINLIVYISLSFLLSFVLFFILNLYKDKRLNFVYLIILLNFINTGTLVNFLFPIFSILFFQFSNFIYKRLIIRT